MVQPVNLNIRMIDEASQVAQSASEKIKDSFGAAFLEVSEKSKSFNEEFKRQEEAKAEAVKNQLTEQGKAFTEFFEGITLEGLLPKECREGVLLLSWSTALFRFLFFGPCSERDLITS